MAFISANIQREVEQATEATMGKKAVRSINIVQHPRDINKTLVTMEVNARYKKRTGLQRDSAKLLRKLLAISDIEEVVLFQHAGKEGMTYLMRSTLTKETANQIDWNRFKPKMLPDVANNYWQHKKLK